MLTQIPFIRVAVFKSGVLVAFPYSENRRDGRAGPKLRYIFEYHVVPD